MKMKLKNIRPSSWGICLAVHLALSSLEQISAFSFLLLLLCRLWESLSDPRVCRQANRISWSNIGQPDRPTCRLVLFGESEITANVVIPSWWWLGRLDSLGRPLLLGIDLNTRSAHPLLVAIIGHRDD